MNLGDERSEQLRFMARGTVRAWGLCLAIGVPLALFVWLAVWIGHHSLIGCEVFVYGTLVTAMGAYYGNNQFERKQRETEREVERKRWEAEQLDREAQHKARTAEWRAASASSHKPRATGTSDAAAS